MAEAIRQMLDEDGSRDTSHRRIVERMHNAPDWGTRGKITWTREELGTH